MNLILSILLVVLISKCTTGQPKSRDNDLHQHDRQPYKETHEKHDSWRHGARHNVTDERETETSNWNHEGHEKTKSREWRHSVGNQNESEEEVHRDEKTVEWEGDRGGNWRHGRPEQNEDHNDELHRDHQNESNDDHDNQQEGHLPGGHEDNKKHPFAGPQGASSNDELVSTTPASFVDVTNEPKDGSQETKKGCPCKGDDKKKNECEREIAIELAKTESEQFYSCKYNRAPVCVGILQKMCPGDLNVMQVHECLQNYCSPLRCQMLQKIASECGTLTTDVNEH